MRVLQLAALFLAISAAPASAYIGGKLTPHAHTGSSSGGTLTNLSLGGFLDVTSYAVFRGSTTFSGSVVKFEGSGASTTWSGSAWSFFDKDINGAIALIYTAGNKFNLLAQNGRNLFIGDDSASAANGITIEEGGNIGVGTDLPDDKLHVSGDVKITASIKMVNGSQDAYQLGADAIGPGFYFYNTTKAAYRKILRNDGGWVTGHNASGVDDRTNEQEWLYCVDGQTSVSSGTLVVIWRDDQGISGKRVFSSTTTAGVNGEKGVTADTITCPGYGKVIVRGSARIGVESPVTAGQCLNTSGTRGSANGDATISIGCTDSFEHAAGAGEHTWVYLH